MTHGETWALFFVVPFVPARFSRPPPFAQALPHDWDSHLARQRQSIAEFAICEGMEDVLALVSPGEKYVVFGAPG